LHVKRDKLRLKEGNMDNLDEILALISQTDSDWYRDATWKHKAAQERVKVAKCQLDTALTAAREGDCLYASRLLVVVRNTLQENNLNRDEWLQIYVAEAICRARLGEKGAMISAWNKARALEPNCEKLREVATSLGLI
jgi:hypothetical protein